jgi:protein TonB
MTPLPRTAISLYVALALHALVLLALALHPPSQNSAGPGQGLSVRGATLSEAERRLVMGVTAPAPMETPTPAPLQNRRRLAPERAPTPSAPKPVRPQVAPPREAANGIAKAADSRVASPGVAQVGGGGQDLYFARLRAHLAGFRRELRPGLPPARSRVRVAITRDGWIEELVLVESSGVPELDAEAMNLLRRAAPLPAPPQGRALRLIVPVEIVPTTGAG